MVMRIPSHRASRGVSFLNLVQQLVYLLAVLLSSIGASASITVLASSSSSEAAAAAAVRTSQSEPPLPPPMAKKVEHKMEMFGDVRVDNYYWLRDDSRSNPDVLSYLQQENNYTQFLMSGRYPPICSFHLIPSFPVSFVFVTCIQLLIVCISTLI